MKIYLINREDGGEYSFTSIVKVFSTLEKAQFYKKELEEKYKDNISFQSRLFYYDIEELEVE